MQKIYFFVVFLIFWGWGINNVSAQYLRIKLQDGTEDTQEINLLQNLQFSDGSLQINFLSGTLTTYELSTVSTLYFQQYPTSVEEDLQSGSQEISIYPNPASDVIYLKNTPETGSIVSIYRIDGMLIFQMQISSQNQVIDVSNLTNGLYLIRVNNQAIKFIKQ